MSDSGAERRRAVGEGRSFGVPESPGRRRALARSLEPISSRTTTSPREAAGRAQGGRARRLVWVSMAASGGAYPGREGPQVGVGEHGGQRRGVRRAGEAGGRGVRAARRPRRPPGRARRAASGRPRGASRSAPERERTFPTSTYLSPILLGVEVRRMGERYVHVTKLR